MGIVAIVIIGTVVSYSYYLDQVKLKGFEFGNDLESIQKDLKELLLDFD